MKIVIDRLKNLTRGDSKNDKKIVLPEKVEIIKIPLDLFAKMGLEYLKSDITVVDTESSLKQYQQLRELVLTDNNLQKQIDQHFLVALKAKSADFDDIFLQKVTYKLDMDENFDDVVKTLQKVNSNALFRALEYNRDINEIVSYCSREGIWKINNKFIAKSIELRSIGSLRTDRALRSVRDPHKFIDFKRTNYHLYEDMKILLNNNIIRNSYATREQPDGHYRDDTRTVYVTKLHFKKELTDEDLKQLDILNDVSEAIKNEITHVNKQQATIKQAEKSLENNKNEIHSKHEPVQIIKRQTNELEIEKQDKFKQFTDRLISDFELDYTKKREEFLYKVNMVMSDERLKAKQTFVTSLANGMTVTEAIDNLRSAKHSNVMIQAVLEDIKIDMMITVKKDEVIFEKSKELESSLKQLESTSKKLTEVEKKNRYNYEAYQVELTKRKKADETIFMMKEYLDKAKLTMESQKADIFDLQNQLKEINNEIISKDNELDEQFNTIESLKKQNSIKNEVINNLKSELKNKDIKVLELEIRLEIIEDFNKKIELLFGKDYGEKIKCLNYEDRKLKQELE